MEDARTDDPAPAFMRLTLDTASQAPAFRDDSAFNDDFKDERLKGEQCKDQTLEGPFTPAKKRSFSGQGLLDSPCSPDSALGTLHKRTPSRIKTMAHQFRPMLGLERHERPKHIRSNSYSASPFDDSCTPRRSIVLDKQCQAKRTTRNITMPVLRSYHRALDIPEILGLILHYVDAANRIPYEAAPKRRKPMSLRHTLLIHGDNEAARQLWRKIQAEPRALTFDDALPAGLYACLLVNWRWNQVAQDILQRQLHFRTDERWQQFSKAYGLGDGTEMDIDKPRHTILTKPAPVTRPRLLVLHKIVDARQSQMEMLGRRAGGRLEWLELYTCPHIVPTRSLLAGGQLKKLALPGCARVSDETVITVAQTCGQLEYLDLRACENVSDAGLRVVGLNCPQLQLLNVGRTNRGELVTYRGLRAVLRRTRLNTLGVAGCAIDDRVVLDAARFRGQDMERLSLNNCVNLTNASVPRVLAHMPRLTVLELRGCTRITDMRPIAAFKRNRQRTGQAPLIEGCELFELRMREAEWLLDMEQSRQILRDCLEWIYAGDDDVEY